MNPWPFVAGAYALALGGVALLAAVSWWSMRRAEKRAERNRRR